MIEKNNLKSLSNKLKRNKPQQTDVARYAGISDSHLSNIVAGRRKASPKLIKKIEEGYRRFIR